MIFFLGNRAMTPKRKGLIGPRGWPQRTSMMMALGYFIIYDQ